jgi:hypothetical protein
MNECFDFRVLLYQDSKRDPSGCLFGPTALLARRRSVVVRFPGHFEVIPAVGCYGIKLLTKFANQTWRCPWAAVVSALHLVMKQDQKVES